VIPVEIAVWPRDESVEADAHKDGANRRSMTFCIHAIIARLVIWP
jgi:hypothetical protein